MSLYNVVKPCVVGNLHYVRPTVIDIDDDVAAQVEDGCLEPVRAPLSEEASADWLAENTYSDGSDPVGDEPPTDPPPARKPRGRRSGA